MFDGVCARRQLARSFQTADGTAGMDPLLHSAKTTSRNLICSSTKYRIYLLAFSFYLLVLVVRKITQEEDLWLSSFVAGDVGCRMMNDDV